MISAVNLKKLKYFMITKKEYKLLVETWNYKDITKFYDMLSGYKYKTKLFVVDCDCQKVAVEIFDLTLKECEKLLEKFKDEMYFQVYENEKLIFEQDNQ